MYVHFIDVIENKITIEMIRKRMKMIKIFLEPAENFLPCNERQKHKLEIYISER